MIDIDRMNNLAMSDVTNGAMAVIDRLQRLPKETQAVSLAATFLLLSEHWGVDPQRVFAATTNIMNHADGRRPEFKAVARYLREEI